MLDKHEVFSTIFALLFELISCAPNTSLGLSYDMTNYLKAMKNFLNEIINDNISGLL